jgi:hypothetical protein
MKMNKYRALLLTGLFGLAVWACKNADPNPARTGTLQLVFDNVAGAQDLQLGTGTYRTASGESITPTGFNYIVSNIKLTGTDGREYAMPQDSSYFLIRENVPATQTISLKNIPAGDYTSASFLIGVDSLRSTMDIGRRTGVLDPAGDHTSANGMYWSWNSGYIFMKLEGTSPNAPTDATGNKTFRYHVGFFGGRDTRTINNLKTVTINFGSDLASVKPTQVPTVTVQTDVLKIFDGPVTISIAKNPEVMVSDYSQTVANNYARMMSYKGMTTTILD